MLAGGVFKNSSCFFVVRVCLFNNRTLGRSTQHCVAVLLRPPCRSFSCLPNGHSPNAFVSHVADAARRVGALQFVQPKIDFKICASSFLKRGLPSELPTQALTRKHTHMRPSGRGSDPGRPPDPPPRDGPHPAPGRPDPPVRRIRRTSEAPGRGRGVATGGGVSARYGRVIMLCIRVQGGPQQ